MMHRSWDLMSLFLVTLSFLLFTYNFQDVFAVPTRHLCRPEQRDALLEFKNEFEIWKPCFDSYIINNGDAVSFHLKMESWVNNNDCCYCDGITCDAKSGKVIEVDLYYACLQGELNSNSSLFRLKSLTTLELSDNNFSGQIPSSIGDLSYLTTLRLSSNVFNGLIPSSIGNLSRLTSLSLASNQFNGEIPSSFGNLNQLTELRLDHNKLTGKLHPNITSLYNLELFEASDNAFTGTFPSSLFAIPFLEIINLENNQLNGALEVRNISSPSKLGELLLDNNNFIGPIPRSISKLVNLVRLHLSHFNTQGPVDFTIFSHLIVDLSLSDLNTTTTIDLNEILSYFKDLVSLDLSGNHVSVTNKTYVSNHSPSLMYYVYLSGCGLTEFPEFLRTQQALMMLHLPNNKIKGQVPGWLWTLPILHYVDLSNNNFLGFERSTKRGLSSVPKPYMKHFFGSRNNFTGKILSFICQLTSLKTLDLSSNNFSGSIPRCLGKIRGTLSTLNLRHNFLSGSLPENIFESLRSLDVGHNKLVGTLPRSLTHCSTLEVLNVESNGINDMFPHWLSSLQKLQVLVLRSNLFRGPIHQIWFPKLRIIDISHNHFNGTFPSNFFAEWPAMSSLGKDEDQSKERYMSSAYYHDSMVLMNKGVALELVRILKIYTALDFSGNKLEGKIPRSIGLLKELHVLNLSNNAFTGYIPSSMVNLTSLESLDVSQNQLSGEIPQELGNLSYLAYMNFSHNHLVGPVPGGTQFRRQNCSCFKDNPGLYGASLDEDCLDIHGKTSQESEKPEQDEDEEEVLNWIAAAIGFASGVVFGLMIGYILASYKPEWFMNPFGRNRRRCRSTTTR